MRRLAFLALALTLTACESARLPVAAGTGPSPALPAGSLGLAFSDRGAYIGQHGSWNRRPRSLYKVIFIPFENGRPAGTPQDVLTGFVSDAGDAYGRPVGVAFARDGALLVADDVGNVVWRVK